MKKYSLEFADINIIGDNIAEVIIHANAEISIERAEVFDAFLNKHFANDFGILINKINQYTYNFEAQLTVASHENLVAIAVINYNDSDTEVTKKFLAMRIIDGWNLKTFSGLELGWQQGMDWLVSQLKQVKVS